MNSAMALARSGLLFGLIWASLHGGTPIRAASAPVGSISDSRLRLIPPAVGEHSLHALTPTWLELRLITTQAPPPAGVDRWNFVTPDGRCAAPAPGSFQITADGQIIPVMTVGFKRRVSSAALLERDLRVENSLYLHLARPLTSGQKVVVTQADGLLVPAKETFAVTVDPLRTSPVINVNQEGYAPAFPKQARLGYYLGNLGELPTSELTDFFICNATTGETVYWGKLTARRDVGYDYSPKPYQQVLLADFSALTTPGNYTLVVPGVGASLPFRIDDGLAMNWLRTYALGLYHQRCGQAIDLPFTRFTHAACHRTPASVPVPQAAYSATWSTIASKSAPGPQQAAPQLIDEKTQFYPIVNQGKIDVAGGHHDAGDYSKYTVNVATLVHLLMFTADALPTAGALDNLGLPESGDGIGDLLQEAKIEADYLAKLQDADGGFYFLVYPENREYEGDVTLQTGDTGDPQVVWPKNTSATAAGVAALAQCASSPAFKRHYPETAASYLEKARLGWRFLQAAIAHNGLEGSYQKITFYGDEFGHLDELAWAATELYLATGDADYQRQLFLWFPDPAAPNTHRWGWTHLYASYGHAIRSYAFAARTGRLRPEQLDRLHLAKCRTELAEAADDALRWTRQSAYGSAFPEPVKRFRAGGWYFSLDQAADLAVAYQLWPRADYFEAIVSNLNYEGGTNPLNLCFLTGMGSKRPQVIVHQFANTDHRALPPTGFPLGNIQTGFEWLPLYGSEPGELTFPADDAPVAPYPFYDRWADMWNTSAEFITVNHARSLLALSALLDPKAAAAPWRYSTARIRVPTAPVPIGTEVTLELQVDELDLSHARIVWEGLQQTPAGGVTYRFTPIKEGPQWVEVEVAWPDGRRVFAQATFTSVALAAAERSEAARTESPPR